jgi:hypothetical protein
MTRTLKPGIKILTLLQSSNTESSFGWINWLSTSIYFTGKYGRIRFRHRLPEWNGRVLHKYLLKLREMQAMMIRNTQAFLEKNQLKRESEGHGIEFELQIQ